MRRCPGKCLGPYLAGVSQQRTTVISPAPQRSSKSWPHSARQVGGSEKMGSQGECGGREDVVGRCAGSGNARAGTALQRAATQGEEKEQAGAWGAWKQRLRADTAYSALLNSVLDSAKPLGPKNTLWSNDTCGQWCSPDRQRFTIFHA